MGVRAHAFLDSGMVVAEGYACAVSTPCLNFKFLWTCTRIRIRPDARVSHSACIRTRENRWCQRVEKFSQNSRDSILNWILIELFANFRLFYWILQLYLFQVIYTPMQVSINRKLKLTKIIQIIITLNVVRHIFIIIANCLIPAPYEFPSLYSACPSN